MPNGLNYPDNIYADHAERKARRSQHPTGADRSTDPGTKPAHYQRAGIETIDYIRATLDGPGFEAYCIGNVLKYVSRYREKGGIEDLRKAQVYLGWAIEPVKPANPAAMREAKVAYDMACDGQKEGAIFRDELREAPSGGWTLRVAHGRVSLEPAGIGDVPHERVPKWSPAWGTAQYQGAPQHPLNAEAIRDHDERLNGPEDEL